jgi:hypothetical protein
MADRNQTGKEKLAALQTALDNLVTIDLSDQAVLQAYVEVQRYSRQLSGPSRILNANDPWIAACAKGPMRRC